MKLIGLMLMRNERWIADFAIAVALQWCDEVLIMLDRCTDDTAMIAASFGLTHPGRVKIIDSPISASVWNEMNLRQMMLVEGRNMGGTHFAIVDADEALTKNLIPQVRGFFTALNQGELLDLPMLAARTLCEYHDDNTVWSKAVITLGFCDMPTLAWRPGADGYQHHSRPPFGNIGRSTPLNRDKGKGGVLHLQFANQRRLLAKHVLYRMVDHLRWPGREAVARLNWKYDQALDLTKAAYTKIPSDWWAMPTSMINLNDVPYQEEEIKKLIGAFGAAAFAGLDLKGLA